MSNMTARIERIRKPKECPECGKAPLASIVYGMPIYNAELERELKEGKVTLGGCCVSHDDPRWECTHCGLKIYRRENA